MPATSYIDINITPTPNIQTAPPTDPTHPANEDTSTLIDTGSYDVLGVGNVNTDTGIYAWANYSLSDDLRPGADQLAPYSPTQTLSEFLDQSFSVPVLVDAFNNATSWLDLYTPTDPLVIDLNGDGVHLTDYGSSPVLFDIDHDGGTQEQTGWVSAQDGIVVYDRNSSNTIDDISETLSEYFNGSVGSNGDAGTKPFANGLAALKSLDSPVGLAHAVRARHLGHGNVGQKSVARPTILYCSIYNLISRHNKFYYHTK